MKIIVLSRKPTLYSTKRLVEAAKKRGHRVEVINTLQCYMKLSTHSPQLYYKNRPVRGIDAVIPRIGASITFYGLAVVRQFEMMGVLSVNESQAIARSRDKLRSLQILSRHNIGLPLTAFARQPDHVKHTIDMVGGAPVIIKLLQGTQGVGVVLADTKQAAESVIEAFYGLDQNILIQQYIKEAGGRDIRALVVGRKVIAAMSRKAKEGEFRSNIHRGGSAEGIDLPQEYRKTAVRAAKVLGLNVAGVDMLESKDGPMIMEVNSSPGLEGIEIATGMDVAGAIIEFIENRLKQAKLNMTRDRINI